MTREEYLELVIKEKGFNRKTFAEHIGVPYTTLCSAYKRGIGGTSVDLVIKICSALGITVESISELEPEDTFHLSDHERRLVLAYREHPDRQNAVDILLGIAE